MLVRVAQSGETDRSMRKLRFRMHVAGNAGGFIKHRSVPTLYLHKVMVVWFTFSSLKRMFNGEIGESVASLACLY